MTYFWYNNIPLRSAFFTLYLLHDFTEFSTIPFFKDKNASRLFAEQHMRYKQYGEQRPHLSKPLDKMLLNCWQLRGLTICWHCSF